MNENPYLDCQDSCNISSKNKEENTGEWEDDAGDYNHQNEEEYYCNCDDLNLASFHYEEKEEEEALLIVIMSTLLSSPFCQKLWSEEHPFLDRSGRKVSISFEIFK
ncbi:hypothetical protein NE237_030418 [Protea cynaroides]|uniref:Uncharacterized protein n=1 Tax=Protea cynaroides TaxID=273540 RepID=A0A9Q0GT15_9MAGN|nr:hypothetical protein NE237_030418 [Protea cynaroides]